MNCTKCGKAVPDGFLFCTGCGSKIERSDENMNAAPVPQESGIVAAPGAETVAEQAVSEETPVIVPPQDTQPVPQDNPPVIHASVPSVQADTPQPNAPVIQPEGAVPVAVQENRPLTVGAIGKMLLSILLSLLLLAMLSAVIGLVIVRPKNLVKAVTKADIAVIVEEMGLSEDFVDSINELARDRFDVDDLESFLKRASVREEIGKVMERYFAALEKGDFDYYLTTKEIVSFLKAIAADVREEFDVRLTDVNYNYLLDTTDKNDLKAYSLGNMFDDIDLALFVPGVAFSVYPLVIVCILSAMLVLNLLLLHRKKIRAAFLYIGIPTMLVGLSFMVMGSLFSPTIGILKSGVAYQVVKMVAGLLGTAFTLGLIFFAIGVALVALCIVIAMVRKNKYPPVTISGLRVWGYVGLGVNVAALISVIVVALLLGLRIQSLL